MHLWPSGSRRLNSVQFSSEVWVRIPPDAYYGTSLSKAKQGLIQLSIGSRSSQCSITYPPPQRVVGDGLGISSRCLTVLLVVNFGALTLDICFRSFDTAVVEANLFFEMPVMGPNKTDRWIDDCYYLTFAFAPINYCSV